MGTVYVSRVVPVMTESELRQWVREEGDRQAYENGHDSYSGSWCAGQHVVFPRVPAFTSVQEADNYIDEHAEKRGAALAVRVGDHSKGFPSTAADTALVERHKAVAEELKFFDFDVYTRARNQKSEKKSCSHCNSSINLKKMNPAMTRQDYAAALQSSGRFGMSTNAYLGPRGEVMLMALVTLTGCPVCGHNLLVTETDTKRKTALVAKVSELEEKVREAKAKHQAREAALKVKPCWVVGANCAS